MITRILLLSILICGPGSWARPPNDGPSFLSLDDPNLPRDYKFQGEYIGDKSGVQVISLSDGKFHAVLYDGGLPGAGWDGKSKCLLDGNLESGRVIFKSSTVPKKYLADDPRIFSATQNFPPHGQREAKATLSSAGKFVLHTKTQPRTTLQKVIRKSSTLGKKAPENALVLFDGTGNTSFIGGRVDEKTGFLHTDGRDILTKLKFENYQMHLEFMLPYRPTIRGQHRGNSGFYQVDLYEMQILDSFGLDGLHFDCGGIYSQKAPMTNACFPPLSWQTYDVEFWSAKMKDGRKIKNARLTAKLNGILIHENYEFPSKTGGSRSENEGTPGPIKLQGHANPLQFRNIWIIEK